MTLLKQILDSIEHFDNQELSKLLPNIDYDTILVDELDALLALLTNTCSEIINLSGFKIIIKEWSENNIMEEKLPTLTYLFTLRLVNDKTLLLSKEQFPEYSFYEHFTNLLDYKNDGQTVEGLSRLDQIYNDQRLSVYLSLYSYIIGQEEGGLIPNIEGKHFIVVKLKELYGYAPVGLWVKNFLKKKILSIDLTKNENTNIDPELPFEEDLKINRIKIEKFTKLPEEDLYLKILTIGLPLKEKSREKEKLRQFYNSNCSLQEKLAPFQEIIRREQLAQLSERKDLFRIFGPVNTIYDYDFPFDNENKICSKYGGCRMLTCQHSTDKKNWFTGNCQGCYKKIKYPWHSVRLPLERGSWEGIYCSFDCMLRVNRENLSSIQYDMVIYYQRKLNKIGIQDRKLKK